MIAWDYAKNHKFQTQQMPEYRRNTSKPGESQRFSNKYWKVKCVYTIDANRGDQNPLDITLRRWAPFPNVFINSEQR